VNTLRYELKFVCQESAYERVRAVLNLDPAGIRRLYPARTVQSVYLDTPFGRALEENRAGLSRRDKLRFRWYGEERGVVQGSLERKFRENQLGWKEVLALDAPIPIEGVRRAEFARALMRHATPDWRALIEHGMEPVQWIAYRRDYLVTADGRIRVTLDRALRTWDQRLRLRLARTPPLLVPHVLVIELKAHPRDHELARQIVNRFPIPVDRCSKFVLASDPASGPHPSIFPA
jgi:hypothetical protein